MKLGTGIGKKLYMPKIVQGITHTIKYERIVNYERFAKHLGITKFQRCVNNESIVKFQLEKTGGWIWDLFRISKMK